MNVRGGVEARPGLQGLLRHWPLIAAMSRREIEARYKGSFGGIGWYVVQTLLTVAIYSFAFGTLLRARWAETGQAPINFTMALFIGLLVYNLFSEAVGRAPTLVVANANYVKKLVFPLEILPVIALVVALCNLAVGIVVFLAMSVLLKVELFWTGLWVPVILSPLVVLIIGLMWFLASLGTFVRDTSQTVSLLITMLMFLSPLFYPASTLPDEFRSWIWLNPVTVPMEQSRRAILFGESPDMTMLAGYAMVALAVAGAGHAWFARTRKAFADVL
jgi:lipopolysaccharide transport system permease protein